MQQPYDWGQPYDPDMTVQEALAAGLIAIIDTGTIATGNYEPCGYEGPFKPQNSAAQDPSRVRCNRSKGHHGTHAHVVRWQQSVTDKKREAARRIAEQQKALADAARKMAKEIGVMGTAIEQSMQGVTKAMMDSEAKRLDRIAAMSYSPMEGHKKNARYRDKNAGKIRGR